MLHSAVHGMIFRYYCRTAGALLLATGLSMLAPATLGLFSAGAGAISFGVCAGGAIALAALLLAVGRGVPEPSKHAAFASLIVGAGAVMLVSAVPFALEWTTPWNALFESVSGWTTTGATIFEAPEKLPASVLLWRAITQWLGGLGILLFVAIAVPYAVVDRIPLLPADLDPRGTERLRPRLAATGVDIAKVYTLLTCLHAILLFLGGVGALDSVCLAMSTLSTGGFMTRGDGLPETMGLYGELVTVAFMILGATNFLLHVRIFQGDVLPHGKNELFRIFAILLLICAGLATADVLITRPEERIGNALRRAIFESASFCTTTGFRSVSDTYWSAPATAMFIAVMFVGGMVGSTAGGLKVQRWTLVARAVYREALRLIHSNRVTSVRILGETVDAAIVSRFLLLGIAWIFLFAGGTLGLLLGGSDLASSVSSAACALNNAGSGLGVTAGHWAGLSAPAKALAMSLMLLGRLEVFAVVAALSPMAWRAPRQA